MPTTLGLSVSSLSNYAQQQPTGTSSTVAQRTSTDTEQAVRDAILNAQDAITPAQGSFDASQTSTCNSAINTVAQFGQ